MVTPDVSLVPLSARLRALVVRLAGPATLTCAFVAGGKLNGVGIPSVLYCQACGRASVWHDVAEAVALAARCEAAERLPFGPDDGGLTPAAAGFTRPDNQGEGTR
jgi:hypothetical protein